MTGVTLSEEQHKLSNDRAQQRGVSERVKFLLKDYRHLDQKFDRIVSVPANGGHLCFQFVL